MIFRVPDPPTTTKSSNLRVVSPISTPSRESPQISEPSETDAGDSSIDQKLVPVHENNLGESARPKLSYIESTEDPFEEIVIRAETFFPGLTNIVGPPSSSNYLFEQPPPQRKLTVRQNAVITPQAEGKRKGEQEIDRRIMMYSQANRKPHGHYMQYQHQPHHQGPPGQSVIHYGGYYTQPMPPPPPAPAVNEPDMDERTTYDYRNFQAARQRFEQRGLVSQPGPAPPTRNHFHRPMLRPQHSITSTVMSMGPSNPMGNSMFPMQSMAPQAPQIQPTFVPQTTNIHNGNNNNNTAPMGHGSNDAGAIVRREPRNIFAGGCGCGPGSGCGALPEAPIQRESITDREVIQQYLISEEMGPGGVKSVFNFPGGVEPSDLTLLRAAIAANQPKDAFIPEENDDLEEQLNIQLQNACPDIETLQQGPVQPPAAAAAPQAAQQPPNHHPQGTQRQYFQTVGRAGGNAGMMTVGGGHHASRPSILKQHSQPQPTTQADQQQQQQPQSGMGGGGDNPLNSLMFNGIGNFMVGPNSPGQQGIPMYQQSSWHQQQSQQQQQQPQLQPQNSFTTYSASSFDAVPMNGRGQNQQLQQQQQHQAGGYGHNRYGFN